MAPESMVHALHRIHTLLKPNGMLIDIHPLGEPPPITVELGETRHVVGWVREATDYQSYLQADAAVATVVKQQLFRRDEKRLFTFTTYADSMDALQQYLAESWSDAFIDDLVLLRANELLHSSPLTPKRVTLLEEVGISRLRPLPIKTD